MLRGGGLLASGDLSLNIHTTTFDNQMSGCEMTLDKTSNEGFGVL